MFTTYLINGTVAIDAGSLGLLGTIDQQARVKHIFLSHIHIDHVSSLGPFVDAVYDGSGDCVTVYANAYTLECLRNDYFNNRLYPDFFKISTFRPPYIKVVELTSGVPIEVEGLRITPITVNHVVPTLGYIIEDNNSAVVFPSDTAPTEEIWARAHGCRHELTVFLECTFPESMGWLAELAKHLTPSLYVKEMKKLGRDARFITIHMHPRHRPLIVKELLALGLPSVEIGEAGKLYAL